MFPQDVKAASGREIQGDKPRNGVFEYSNTLSPATVLTVRTGAARVIFDLANQSSGFAASSLGLPKVIEQNVIKRPEFAGVNSPVSTRGEGGQALARGEGDMALQAICEILPYKEIELVGPLPRELAAWIDMSTAVSARSANLDQALAFIRYITRPEATAVWKAKGLNRF